MLFVGAKEMSSKYRVNNTDRYGMSEYLKFSYEYITLVH